MVWQPFRNLVPNLVYAASGSEIDHVIINGQLVMTNGTFPRLDEAAIIEAANQHARALMARAQLDWERAGSRLVDNVRQGWL